MKTFLLLSLVLIFGCNKNLETPSFQNAFGNKDFSFCMQQNLKTYRYNFKFVSGNNVHVEIIHNSYLCKPGFDYFKETYEAGYSFDPLSEEITETRHSTTFTILEENEVTSKNNDGYCGITDWVINEPRVIDNLNCDGEYLNPGMVSSYKGYFDNGYFYLNDVPYSLIK